MMELVRYLERKGKRIGKGSWEDTNWETWARFQENINNNLNGALHENISEFYSDLSVSTKSRKKGLNACG
jgi:hypothetical protein